MGSLAAGIAAVVGSLVTRFAFGVFYRIFFLPFARLFIIFIKT